MPMLTQSVQKQLSDITPKQPPVNYKLKYPQFTSINIT